MNHFINTDAPDLARARTVSLQNLIPAPFPVLAVGSQATHNFYFAENGVISSISGDSDLTLRVTIGDVASGPIGGTYSLTVANNDPLTLPWNLDASGLQNALNSDSTIASEGYVDVVQQGNGRFIITHRELGEVSGMTIDVSLLAPDCVASLQVLTTGSSTVRQLTMLTIRRAIPVQSTSFTPITSPYNGWTGVISLNNAATLELIRLNGIERGGLIECQTVMTVEVVETIDETEYPTVYFQSPIILRALNYTVSAQTSMATQNFFARPAIVGLASNVSNSTLLGGLTTSTGTYPAGSTVQCQFADDVVVNFIRKASTTSQSVPWIVRPYDYNASNNAYQWVLDRVSKQGVPATYDADLGKWTYIVTVGAANAVAVASDQTGFTLPS